MQECEVATPGGKEGDAAANSELVSFFPVDSLDDKVDTDKLSDLSLALSHMLLDNERWGNNPAAAVTVAVSVDPESAVTAGDATPI